MKDLEASDVLRIIIQDLLIAGVLFVATGCLISSHNTVQETGRPVSATTMNQIEVGKTTEAWLMATLGEPTSRCKVQTAEGATETQILRYEHKRIKSSSGTVLFLFSGSSCEVDASRACFEVTDGVVTRQWIEG